MAVNPVVAEIALAKAKIIVMVNIGKRNLLGFTMI